MKDLINALTILLKYANDDRNPIHCEHDQLYIGCGITLDMVSKEDLEKLEELGIFWSESDDSFISFRFGSC
jgi:hypothetical protein